MARRTVQAGPRPVQGGCGDGWTPRIAGIAGTVTWRRLKDIVAAAILAADPPKATDDCRTGGGGGGGVPGPGVQHGYQTMIINAAAGDVNALDEASTLIARALKILGDTRGPASSGGPPRSGSSPTRRAALDLLARAEQVRQAQLRGRRRPPGR